MIEPAHVTGLILAGGRGSRMGGLDKGLQLHAGRPLALHALQRLAPQVGPVMLNANRHLADYATWGVPVWPDARADFAGPLAGLLAGLAHCTTRYLVAVPCDAPRFPLDLVQRLAGALVEADAELVIAATRGGGELRAQPVFCLMRTSLQAGLQAFVDGGGRKVGHWARGQRCVQLPFDDARAFANINTLAELHALPGED
jgi:molybdopterin-guanine dinucleotide biosynthesis protein A